MRRPTPLIQAPLPPVPGAAGSARGDAARGGGRGLRGVDRGAGRGPRGADAAARDAAEPSLYALPQLSPSPPPLTHRATQVQMQLYATQTNSSQRDALIEALQVRPCLGPCLDPCLAPYLGP